MDYFDPILIKSLSCKQLKTASAKRPRVLFTCFMIRAVHLAFTHDMSTDALLLSLCRFSRRGSVKVLGSDNGSNFTAVEKELKEALKQVNHDKTIDVMSRQSIE